MNESVVAEQPFPALSFLLRHAKAFPVAAAAIVLALLLWLALRTGWIELAVLAPIVAVAAHFLVRVALDVASLVAETLMPR